MDSSKQSPSSLEAIHYRLPVGAAAGSSSTEACEVHSDKGLLTVIYADTVQGLQVGAFSNLLAVMLTGAALCECRSTACECNMQVQGPDGTWRGLPLSQGRGAVLAEYTLERATCGLTKAAKHRVVCPSEVSVGINCHIISRYHSQQQQGKLRAPDTAVLDLYAALSKHHQHAICPRYCCKFAVYEGCAYWYQVSMHALSKYVLSC